MLNTFLYLGTLRGLLELMSYVSTMWPCSKWFDLEILSYHQLTLHTIFHKIQFGKSCYKQRNELVNWSIFKWNNYPGGKKICQCVDTAPFNIKLFNFVFHFCWHILCCFIWKNLTCAGTNVLKIIFSMEEWERQKHIPSIRVAWGDSQARTWFSLSPLPLGLPEELSVVWMRIRCANLFLPIDGISS